MIYTCLNNWIGIQDCDSSTSDSGVFINDLQGVGLKQFDSLTDGDQQTALEIFEKVKNNALRRFSIDVTAEFAKRYRLKTVLKSLDFGRKLDKTNVTAKSAEYRGFIYELNQENNTRTASNLKLINIQTLNLFMSTAQNTTVKVFDLDTEEQLFTKDVVGTIGFNNIEVNQDFDAYRIFVAYDSTDIDSVELNISNLQISCDCDGRIRGATSTIADPFAVEIGNQSFGLSAVISERCSYNKLVCNNKSNFTTPLLYLMGVELMNERINSTAINRFTTTDIVQAKELRIQFELQYRGGQTGDDNANIKVDGALEKSIAGINLFEWDACIECSSEIRSAYARV